MKRDPTPIILLSLLVFYGLFAVARWGFVLFTDYPTSAQAFTGMSLVIAGLSVLLLGFLLYDAKNPYARLFWGLCVIRALVVYSYRALTMGTTTGFSEALPAIDFTIMTILIVIFTILYRETPYSLLGRVSIRILDVKVPET